MGHGKSGVNLPSILFHEGMNYHCYDYFGVHRMSEKYVFRLWAPGAEAVFLILFLENEMHEIPMTRITEGGIWEVFVHTAEHLDAVYIYDDLENLKYRFKLQLSFGEVYRNDPFAFNRSPEFDGAAVIRSRDNFRFEDYDWEFFRFNLGIDEGVYPAPMNICRVNVAEYMKDNGLSNFKELACHLFKFVKGMGYTHVLLSNWSAAEMFEDEGFCYTGAYSVGDNKEESTFLKYLVNKFHKGEIGVLLDWSPGFYVDLPMGLSMFDGTPLYEKSSCAPKCFKGKAIKQFDVGKKEIISFLISNAFYLFDKFHIDGLNVCLSTQLLDLNYKRSRNEWVKNRYGGRENLEAVCFFRELNDAVKKEFSDRILISAHNRFLSENIIDKSDNGFGFFLTMDDISDAEQEKDAYLKTLLSRDFLFGEKQRQIRYFPKDILCKGGIFDGADDLADNEKEAAFRVLRLLHMTLPCKKIENIAERSGIFGDSECLGAFFDVNEALKREDRRYRYFTEYLNKFYSKSKCLYDNEISSNDGVDFVYPPTDGKVVFKRTSIKGEEITIAVNLSTTQTRGIIIPANDGVVFFKTVLDTNEKRFGGSGASLPSRYRVRKRSSDIEIVLPPLCGVILEPLK